MLWTIDEAGKNFVVRFSQRNKVKFLLSGIIGGAKFKFQETFILFWIFNVESWMNQESFILINYEIVVAINTQRSFSRAFADFDLKPNI